MAVAFHPLTVTEIERDTSSSVLVTLSVPIPNSDSSTAST